MDVLEKGTPYLFVSNHRDIMLDASLLQNVLVDHGMETAQITFGANLMMNQLVVDIGKSNKMFRVERPGNSAREFYKSSIHLSEYIRNVIIGCGESVWIAQRNGRTKDGNDQTDQGIIKMFCMSKADDKISALKELNIVPVSVSYEWESCDILKAIEEIQLDIRRDSGYLRVWNESNNTCWPKDERALFSEGVVIVKKSGLFGYINREGKQITPCKYEQAQPFSNGYAFVELEKVLGEQGNKQRRAIYKGYVDKNGKEALVQCEVKEGTITYMGEMKYVDFSNY